MTTNVGNITMPVSSKGDNAWISGWQSCCRFGLMRDQTLIVRFQTVSPGNLLTDLFCFFFFLVDKIAVSILLLVNSDVTGESWPTFRALELLCNVWINWSTKVERQKKNARRYYQWPPRSNLFLGKPCHDQYCFFRQDINSFWDACCSCSAFWPLLMDNQLVNSVPPLL